MIRNFNLPPDIVPIDEIKMNKEQANIFLRFDGFSSYYKPRKGNPEYGEGVAIIVKDTISHVILSELDKEDDQVGVKIKINNQSYNSISLYSPINQLSEITFKRYSSLGLELSIMGDLNAKTPTIGCQGLNKNGEILEEVLSLAESNLCVLNVESPTFFQFKRGFSDILNIFLYSKTLANKMFYFNVLTDHKMDSDQTDNYLEYRPINLLY